MSDREGEIFRTMRSNDCGVECEWSESDDDDQAEILLENREYYQEKMRTHPEWVSFFSDFDDLILGHKIGQGGQAVIYSATSQSHRLTKLAAKVFDSRRNLLRDLEQQWPPQMLSTLASRSGFPFEHILGGALLDDGRVAFVMEERWGDLRKLIDLRCRKMEQHAPPFSDDEVIHILWSIASDLKALHDADVTHKDIKSHNVLLLSEEPNVVQLIDFEVSMVGVHGTRFWRAPEILKVVQRRNWRGIVFTKECDIYSFGMVCYEVITGCIPFENHSKIDYKFVIEERQRPELPSNLKPALKKLVYDCWQHDPLERPCVTEVVDRLVMMRNPH